MRARIGEATIGGVKGSVWVEPVEHSTAIEVDQDGTVYPLGAFAVSFWVNHPKYGGPTKLWGGRHAEAE